MTRISKKLALVASLTAVVVGLGTGVAFAQGDTDDSISPPNTFFTATSTNFTLKLVINGLPITVTCKNVTISGTTPASGLGPINIAASFSGCTDNAGGTDTITINSTNGPWQLTFIDSTAAGEETQTEPNSGDSLKVTISKAGATLKSTALPGCLITAAPAGPAAISGSFDDFNTLSFSNASLPVKGAGCTATTATLTATFKFNINFHDGS